MLSTAALLPVFAVIPAGNAQAQVIIDNGVVQLGINPAGNLITGGIGLTFLPTGGEALAPGCSCEAWGVADFANAASGFGIGVATGVTSTPGVTHTATVTASGTGTDPSSTGSSAVSTTDISVGGSPFLQVIHDFAPSASPNLYGVGVTITNAGAAGVTDLRYRRAMDWDVPPTEFSEFVTIQGWPAANLIASSDDGFENGNPLAPNTALNAATQNVNFENNGPADHGAVFDFSFGALGVGASREFDIFYGAADTIPNALAALAAVNAEVYSLGVPSNFATSDPLFGTPNTFIFGFAGVGGVPIGGAVPVYVATNQTQRQLATITLQEHLESIGMRMNGLVGGADTSGPTSAPEIPADEPVAFYDPTAQGLRFFGTGSVTFGNFDVVPDSDADFITEGGNIGIEHVWTNGIGPIDAFNVGLAGGFGHGSADQDSSAPSPVETESNAFNISGFAGVDFLEGGYANAVLGYSFIDYDHERTLVADTYEGDTSGHQFGALLRIGYDFALSGSDTHLVSVGPYAIAELIDGSIDGFSESSATAPATALSYPTVDYQDIRSQIGGRAHFERSMPWGSASLTASAGWERLHDDSRDPVIAVTAGGLGSIAPINLNEDDLVNVGARVAANIHGRVAVAGEYEGTFGDDYEQNAVRGRVRIGF